MRWGFYMKIPIHAKKKGCENMSMMNTVSLDCPSCGEQFETSQWQSLNSELNPNEKEQLINGTLFKITCPYCAKAYNFLYPILYHDMKNKAMIQLVLDEKNAEEFKSSLQSAEVLKEHDLILPDDYRYRCVSNHIELREKAMLFNCGLDDRVIEFLKLIYLAIVKEKKTDVDVSDILFYHDTEHKLIIFSEGKPVFDIKIDMEKYNEIAKDKRAELEEKSKDCFFINHEWATALIK